MPAMEKTNATASAERAVVALAAALPSLERDVPLAPLCAYGVGGPAEYLFAARSQAQLERAVALARELRLPLTVLGQATNVLIADAGLRGLVVLVRNAETHLEGELLTVGAGAVVPEQGGDRAGLDRQGDPAHRLKAAVADAQVFDGGGHPNPVAAEMAGYVGACQREMLAFEAAAVAARVERGDGRLIEVCNARQTRCL